jgi:cyclopropane-fatty-acyl-phospholipid synthase
VRFYIRDYRDPTGSFDRIVSVGMFEHVGINHYGQYFDKTQNLLTTDGVALLHTFGRMESSRVTDPWVRKYIFPGGYVPAPSEIESGLKKRGLWLMDVKTPRLHYAFTLRDWRHRYAINREAAVALYEEWFCRIWKYYLAICEVSFYYLLNTVFQFQMTRLQGSLPLTRQHLSNAEYRHVDTVSEIEFSDLRCGAKNSKERRPFSTYPQATLKVKKLSPV